MFETIEGENHVRVCAFAGCWRSFWSAHALAAPAAQGALGWDQSMAVLIQPVIEAECAGVCFTADPVQRRRELCVVHSAWGLGIGVVEGSVANDTARMQRAGFAVDERQIAEQEEQIVLAPAGGTQRVPVPAARRRSASLPDAWLQRIAQFGVASERLFGAPQDLEWAVGEGQAKIHAWSAMPAISPTRNNAPQTRWLTKAAATNSIVSERGSCY